ncbi:thioredoxin [Candidatus Nitrososphaera evergladensis SR1]|uniref:Thioredoxin n=1 Tax=Candidatus Nitrososphaera evergladensis SR1 TaxID=1459636 RepID=A0A075MUG1_9ARCH|nr:thioredoxin [Candidatus Nitrososphaera evergladensis]AIF82954.1 thioredoxin [Candidatus Nitrososphaera evergladensis SR1]
MARVNKMEFGRSGNNKEVTIDTPIALTDSNFEQALQKYPLLIVDFFAPWCGSCRMLVPTIEQMASEMAGKTVFGRLNVDENPRITSLFEVQSVPTVIIFRNGELLDGFRGVAPKAQIRSRIKSMIATIMSL